MELEKAKLLARQLMDDHDLEHWKFTFDRSKKRFGCCKHGKLTITLSKELVLLNDEKNVKDTILHEISHALVGARNGHNDDWKDKCREVGCSPSRCYNSQQVVAVETKHYLLSCSNCGRTHKQFRRPTKKGACSFCCKKYNDGKYTDKFELEWRYVEK